METRKTLQVGKIYKMLPGIYFDKVTSEGARYTFCSKNYYTGIKFLVLEKTEKFIVDYRVYKIFILSPEISGSYIALEDGREQQRREWSHSVLNFEEVVLDETE